MFGLVATATGESKQVFAFPGPIRTEPLPLGVCFRVPCEIPTVLLDFAIIICILWLARCEQIVVVVTHTFEGTTELFRFEEEFSRATKKRFPVRKLSNFGGDGKIIKTWIFRVGCKSGLKLAFLLF